MWNTFSYLFININEASKLFSKLACTNKDQISARALTCSKFSLFISLTIFHLFALSAAAIAQDSSNSSGSSSYHSLRASIYSQDFGDLETKGYSSRFKFYLTTALLKYDTLDEYFDAKSLHIRSVGIRPQINFVFSTRWEHITVIPSLEMSIIRDYDVGKYLMSGSVAASFRYDNLREVSYLVSAVTLKYGTRYDVDGINNSDYFSLTLFGQLRQNMKWTIAGRTTTVTPFASISYFFDELEYSLEDDIL